MLLDKEAALTEKSWYEASVQRAPALPPLQERQQVDVCVVGGGYAGLASALHLAQRGYSVTLLEARRVGWGASGRNGGQAIVGYASDDAILQQFSGEDARRAWMISVEAMELLRATIAQYQIACDYTPGYLSLAVNAKKARRLFDWCDELERRFDYRMQKIPAQDVSQWIASKRFHAGAYDPLSGHLHPLKYCLGLAQAAQQHGVKIYENCAVNSMQQGQRVLLRTAQGEVSASFVVLAGNVYLDQFSPALAPGLQSRIMPVGTYIIASEAMTQERADALIAKRAAVCDTNFVLDYFRPTADHRMLFGGRVSYSTATPMNLAASMRARMLEVFPQLSDLQVPWAWGGFVDITVNRAPDFGRLAPNIYYLQGFSGHGLALSGMAGKLCAQAIAGQAERFDLLARIRHLPFPGGRMMRTPALVLGMAWYRLLDLL
ncbi:FAD-binding oxidoreductase [Massilia sp. W12]|uniref:NAD(P)/FAD-dependent oxidoreductase n=1 Tax=Massilia sp. W12 TaxID=3126507 RepID=UPI0030CAACC6